MQDIGKILIILGFIVILTGMVFYFGWAPVIFGWMGRLPGDIRIERNNGSFYFPITTCIVISVILSLLFRLMLWFRAGS